MICVQNNNYVDRSYTDHAYNMQQWIRMPARTVNALDYSVYSTTAKYDWEEMKKKKNQKFLLLSIVGIGGAGVHAVTGRKWRDLRIPGGVIPERAFRLVEGSLACNAHTHAPTRKYTQPSHIVWINFFWYLLQPQ